MGGRHTTLLSGAVLLLLAAIAGRASAQDLPPIPALDTVEIAAGPQYDASGFHRFFFGDGYRGLWAARIRVPVVDLARFAGGVRATEEGGGFQTKSLRLMTEDGIEYVVRSVNKDPSAILPPRIRARSAVRSIVQDQVSAAFPASALAIPPMVSAIGLKRPDPHLVVLPDDERLGEWREEYAGKLMMLEQYPSESEDNGPGFAGESVIEASDDLFERLNESPAHSVDTTGFLAARMLDFVINDWDRHDDQWRWIAEADGKDTVWTPVPRDRDQAFISFDGFLLSIAQLTAPRLVSFDAEPQMKGMTHNSRYLDRRLLAGVERERFDSVAAWVQARLTDEVIAEGLARLPDAYQAAARERVAPIIRIRRDSLRSIAARFYERLAGAVDVHATDEEDLALIERHDDGAVTVRLLEDDGDGDIEELVSGEEEPEGDAYFERRFDPAETQEVRVYLHGDDDRAVVTGQGPGSSVTVRVIGGRGANEFADSSRAGRRRTPTHFYDEGETALVTYGPDSLISRHIDRRPWVLPPGESREPVAPPPDYGSGIAPLGHIGASGGLGLTWGAGASLTSYGFQHAPFARRIGVMLEHATGPDDFRATASVEFRREMSHVGLRFTGVASGLEVIRFHGLGNGSPPLVEGDRFFEVEHGQYRLSADLVFPVGRSAVGTVGPVIQHATTETPNDRFIGLTQPFGSEDFTQLGIGAHFDWNGAHEPGLRMRGFRFIGGGTFYPGVLDVEEAFGHMEAEVRRYIPLPLPRDPQIALRAGARRVWGEFPFYEAAFLGGPGTLRGYTYQRFAGDAAAWGSAELRLKLFSYGFLLPGDVGVLGLADAGRVWLEGETGQESWHNAWGAGVWVAFIDEAGTVALTFADGDEGTQAYLSMGFGF